MPVGTLGAVKGLAAEHLEAAGASIMLSNLYHLKLRPGIDAIEEFGGIHAFTGWSRPILTDSGGFQVFSLSGLRKVDEDGVTFRNHIDGGLLRFTPESVVADQVALGVDIAMMLDECPPWPVERSTAEAALARTTRWAERAREAWPKDGPGGLFGIVQGSVWSDLRRRACHDLSGLGFDGYAIGGVSVGEPGEELQAAVEVAAPELPDGRPRYLMGVGYPTDILHAVAHGVDMFDCVLPARNGRHGTLFTRNGVVRIKNARHRYDSGPIDMDCGCTVCRRHSRAFLHHLFRCGEVTAKVLATLHNVTFYLDFVSEVGEAIASGTFSAYRRDFESRYAAGDHASREGGRSSSVSLTPP